ncbi:fimbrial protein [Pseudocitrobacter cyperus]|uniref:Fimbrial protein n=1 Tax=Pseudocitrobacter cyperus TaxID=3112843 RepID=A0ABV0HHE2_9ENTR
MKIRDVIILTLCLLGSAYQVAQASCKSDSGAQKESTVTLTLDSLSLSSKTTNSPNLSLSSGTFSCSAEWLGSGNRIAIISELSNSTAYVDYGNYILQFNISNISPNSKSYSGLGESRVSGTSLNNVTYTYEAKLLKTLPAGATAIKAGPGVTSVTLSHAISVVDSSGIQFWFPGVNFAEFIKWILGLIGSDESKRLFYQNITINYRPRVSTCSIPDTNVTLPETDLTSLKLAGKEAQFYTNFTLRAECSDLLEGMTTRTIQFYLSSSNVETDHYTLKNSQGTARNIGVRVMRADTSKKIAISANELSAGNITSEYELFKIAQWGNNFNIPLRAYYYIYGANPTEGSIQTTAKVNIVYP